MRIRGSGGSQPEGRPAEGPRRDPTNYSTVDLDPIGYRQLAPGQRARLVQADHVDRGQGFDGAELLGEDSGRAMRSAATA